MVFRGSGIHKYAALAFIVTIGFVALTTFFSPQPPTKNQIQLLANKIVKNTPEYVHFAGGTKFSWVLLSLKTDSVPESVRDDVIHQLKEKYTVYLRENDVPDNLKKKGPNGSLMGYKDGFSFSFEVKFEKRRTVKVSYSDFEGNVAASSHWTRYRWTGKDWKETEKSPVVVS